jgi:hypothetical protein
VPGLRPPDAKDAASGTLATGGAAQLGRVGPHVVSLGACFFTDVDPGKLIETVVFPGLYRQRRRRKLSLFRRAPGEKQRKPPLHFP